MRNGLFIVLFLTVFTHSHASILNLGFERNGDKRGINAQIRTVSFWLDKVTVYAEESVDGKVEKVACSIDPQTLSKNGIDLIGFMRLAADAKANARIICYGQVDLNQELVSGDTLGVVADKISILIGSQN